MGGHSHWAGIKHKKALLDSKRGKVWTRIVREITIAAKLGGGDPAGNPRLRRAIDDAKAANMPAENVKRAIQKGTGELPGAMYEELTYEGYGPGGVAVLVEVLTDNRNRTGADIRSTFSRAGGSIAEPGAVGWQFERKGYVLAGCDSRGTNAFLVDAEAAAGAFDAVTPAEAFAPLFERAHLSVEDQFAQIAHLPLVEV